MIVLLLSPLLSLQAYAQSQRGGAGASGAAEGQEQQGAGQIPFGQTPGQRGPGNNLAPPQLDPEPAISRQQALNFARDRFQGRVLSVRMVGGDWRIRMDQNGTVFNVFVDGRSGAVSRAAE